MHVICAAKNVEKIFLIFFISSETSRFVTATVAALTLPNGLPRNVTMRFRSTPAWVDNDLWFDVLLAATVASLLDDLDVVVHSGTRHGGSRVVVTLGGYALFGSARHVKMDTKFFGP